MALVERTLIPHARGLARLGWMGVRLVPIARSWRRAIRDPARWPAVGVEIRTLLEDLGAGYAKLGQFLCARYDLLPEPVCHELRGLLDSSPPEPFVAIARVVESALGRNIDSLFQSFDPTPLATGSIAQVHRAVASDGEPVAVKVRRPGVALAMSEDAAAMRLVATISACLAPERGGRLVREVLDDFAEQFLSELDLAREADAIEEVAATLCSDSAAPAVRRDLSSADVLTMELIEGLPLTAISGIPAEAAAARVDRTAPGTTLAALTRRFAEACFWQYYVTGVFHADPHAGNVILTPEGRIAFVDFGLVGRLSPHETDAAAGYVLALSEGRFRDGLDCLDNMLLYDRPERRSHFRRSARRVLEDWRAAAADPLLPRSQRASSRYHQRMMGLMREHHVRTRPQYVLFWRAQTMLDATALGWPSPVSQPELIADFLRRERGDLIRGESNLRPRRIRPPIRPPFRRPPPIRVSRPRRPAVPTGLAFAIAGGGVLLVAAAAVFS